MAKAWIALIAWLCLALPAAEAQIRSERGRSTPPAWSELTPEQQGILAPLSKEWAGLDATRRKKWIAIAKRYPKMTPQAQERLQKRMVEWAKLTPEQRRAARERYQQIKSLPPDQRRQIDRQWRAYQRAVASQPDLSPSDPPAPPEPPAAPPIPPSKAR
jgi:hypothetical protein